MDGAQPMHLDGLMPCVRFCIWMGSRPRGELIGSVVGPQARIQCLMQAIDKVKRLKRLTRDSLMGDRGVLEEGFDTMQASEASVACWGVRGECAQGEQTTILMIIFTMIINIVIVLVVVNV